MRKKNTKPLGYLLDILNIRPTDLAKAIHVDRTNISKWIYGVRPFDIHSAHYEAVVGYLIEFNATQNINTLEKLFSGIYGIHCENNVDALRKCIDRFLSHMDMPDDVIGFLSEAKGNMFYCTMPIYYNADGRYTAFTEMLNYIEQSDECLHLYLFDNQQFTWIIKHEEYFQDIIDRLVRILELGHNVSMITNPYYMQAFIEFMSKAYVLSIYKNFSEYYFTATMNPKIIASYYIIKGKMSITGYDINNDDDELYTCVRRDPFTAKYSEQLLIELMKDCRKGYIIINNTERFRLFYKIIKYDEIDEVSYTYSPMLPFVTMSRELLQEILSKNKVYGEIQNQLMNLFDAIVKNLHKQTLVPLERHLCYFNKISKDCEMDTVYHEELSVLIGKDVYLTREQYIRNIKEAAELLLDAQNLSIGFLIEGEALYRYGYSCKTKRNLYHVVCNRLLKYVDEPHAVNNVLDTIDEEWNNRIPSEYKDNTKVSHRLLSLVTNCSQIDS